jgi:CheY-like chemotaxis protein
VRVARQLTLENAKPTVLVVDDERVIADTLVAILTKNGFNATAFYSGETAIAAAQRSAQPYSVVSDIMMSGMNGIEVAIKLGKLCPACAVILISGATGSGDLLEEARAQGHHFDVLAKPFHPNTLIELLRATQGAGTQV